MSVTEISAADFEEKIKKHKGAAVLDFHAEWCGPCQMLAPLLEQTSEDYPDVAFYSVDTDAEPLLAASFGVEGIPCLIRFEDGREVSRSIGLVPLPKLKKFIEGNR